MGAGLSPNRERHRQQLPAGSGYVVHMARQRRRVMSVCGAQVLPLLRHIGQVRPADRLRRNETRPGNHFVVTVFALSAALLYGCADFLGGVATDFELIFQLFDLLDLCA